MSLPATTATETVLVAVTGMSPAILTETVWALAHERPVVRPAKVVAFCTARSRERVRQDLLASGIWESLRAALKARPGELEFGDTGDHIRVITRGVKELDDIRTPEDNAAAADFILGHLRQFTENPDLRVVASIAGGRKTMSALLYAAMSLIGRETDRVAHVLVNPALEQRRPPFFFPANATEARGVTLADVPFVPLRNKFEDIGRMPGGFSVLVRNCARCLSRDAPARVRFDDATLTVHVNDASVSLGRRAYLVLKYAADLSEKGQTPVGIDVDESDLKRFIAASGLDPQWGERLDVKADLRHELTAIRRALDRAGIAWKPGRYRHAMRLPPFSRLG